MQLDWTTFLLEIVNFLVLVWILKRFLYKPVLDMIARRKASIEQTLNEAHATENRAGELKASYEKRLDEWEQERESSRAKLREELAAEKERRLTQLSEALEAEREKNRSLDQRRAEETRRTAEAQALELGADFAARLLGRLAGAELDARLLDILIEDLAKLSTDQRASLQAAAAESGVQVQIKVARELSTDQRQRLSAALQQALSTTLPETVQVAPDLLAGVRVAIGPWVMKANLRDELAFFRSGVLHA